MNSDLHKIDAAIDKIKAQVLNRTPPRSVTGGAARQDVNTVASLDAAQEARPNSGRAPEPSRVLERETLPEIEARPTYPLAALGVTLGNAAKAIANAVQAPPELAAQSVLSVAALIAQSKANAIIDGRSYPLSLFALTIARSGDRKSACDSIAMKPVTEWQREEMKHYREAMAGHDAAQEIYEREKKASKGKPDKITSQPPELPPSPSMICQEPTLEGLQKSFVNGLPSQGLFNDEGAQFFGGHTMNRDNRAKSIAGMSKFWDGSPINRTRAAAGESFTLFDRRLSIHLMAQPIITAEVLGDPLLIQQGFLARFLIADTQSLAGERCYTGVDASALPIVTAYQDRIAELLAEPMALSDDGGLELQALELSAEAKALWIEFYDETERAQGAGEELELVGPVVSKIGENALRIAGVITVIEGHTEVSAEVMRGAVMLTAYYLKQALRIAQSGEAEAIERRAVEVLEWIKGQGGSVDAEKVRRNSPRALGLRKSADKTRAFIAGMTAKGWLVVTATNANGKASEWSVADVET